MAPFARLLRAMRTEAGLGIKGLAPELGVSYSYLSKLENDEVAPSQDLVLRIAQYFEVDSDRLLISAGKIPPEILQILQDNPNEAIDFLRHRFGRARK